MGSAASLVSIFSGALSFLCTIGSLCTDCWQVNSKGSVMLSVRCRGLWGECVWDKFVKIWTCDVFSSYLNPHPDVEINSSFPSDRHAAKRVTLPASAFLLFHRASQKRRRTAGQSCSALYATCGTHQCRIINECKAAMITARASLITSAVAGAVAFLCLLSGCRYFSCGLQAPVKRRCLYLSVGCYLFAGLLSCFGVIRYCMYVFSQHQYEVSLNIPGFPSFEYGYSLWMAAAGDLAALVAAVTSYYEAVLMKAPGANLAKEMAADGTGAACTYV